jgi:hypothetical protein
MKGCMKFVLALSGLFIVFLIIIGILGGGPSVKSQPDTQKVVPTLKPVQSVPSVCWNGHTDYDVTIEIRGTNAGAECEEVSVEENDLYTIYDTPNNLFDIVCSLDYEDWHITVYVNDGFDDASFLFAGTLCDGFSDL